MVITGSQIPLVEGRNDGIDNLLGAITLAGHFDLPEVCLFFHNQLFRGSRVVKKNCSDLDAFGSPNMDALCKVGKCNTRVPWRGTVLVLVRVVWQNDVWYVLKYVYCTCTKRSLLSFFLVLLPLLSSSLPRPSSSKQGGHQL